MEAQVQAVSKTIKYTNKDRQWDARFNSVDDESDAVIVSCAQFQVSKGRLRYILVGGPEVGTNPRQDDYGLRHVHLCLLFNNPYAKATVLNMFNIVQGYYLQQRNRSLPYSGWRNHHVKAASKVDPKNAILFEYGELPTDYKSNYALRSTEEKKRKVDEVLVDIKEMLKNQKTEDEIFEKYPRNWMQYGERIKSMMVQRKDFFQSNGDPHIWLYGSAGSGKSSLINYVYPNAYSKNLYNRYFDLYDPTKHDHVVLEDLDHAAVESLSLNFIKTLCDESGFTYDQKYKAAQPARTTVIVTSQFDIGNILMGQEKQVEIAKQGKAIRRRFWEIKVTELHRILSIKLRTPYELRMLKQEGNTDMSKCYLGWNYPENMPSLKPVPAPLVCQSLIRNAFYATA